MSEIRDMEKYIRDTAGKDDGGSTAAGNGLPTTVPPEETVLDRRYRILRKIGEGGFGVTYEAENLHTGQHVAVKEQKSGDITRFLREARVLHDYADEPNIVTVLDYFEENLRNKLNLDPITARYLHAFMFSGTVAVLREWLTNDPGRSPEEIADTITSMQARLIK